MALIQSLDFFTPIDDDPYYYGSIAACNALSDIYAMGGKPLIALNIVAFPCDLDIEILSEILRGGSDKVRESGALLVGGHTIKDKEPKYGLSVSGIVNPSRILKNYGALPGDKLILTKPLGTGIISTALKCSKATKSDVDKARESMNTLNRKAAEIISNYNIHACTDITGFGLGGHLIEMSTASNVNVHIDTKSIKLIGNVLDYAKQEIYPGGMYSNKQFASNNLVINDVKDEYVGIVFDPQTSGGLLISVDSSDADLILDEMKSNGMEESVSLIGSVETGDGKLILE